MGGISFVPSFGTKGFFQKNVGEEAVGEAVGEAVSEVGGDILDEDGGESSTNSAEVGITSEAGGESAGGGILRQTEGGVDAGAPAGIDACTNIDAKVAAAQEILDEAMAKYSKEVQAEAYDDFVEVLKKKNECSG